MARVIRKPFQGVWNIVRFNWHFYLFAFIFLLLVLMLGFYAEPLEIYALVLFFFALTAILISLATTFYVYDLSNLYRLDWLAEEETKDARKIVNINAGFDETSELLLEKYKNSELAVFDFYDPKKHTEISIKRARKAYPPYPITERVETDKFPLADETADKIFAVLSAHEIRDNAERTRFFEELHRILKSNGRVFIVEHLRDWKNFAAYNVGFFHFYPKQVWIENFQSAKFALESEIKITPFITVFVLRKI